MIKPSEPLVDADAHAGVLSRDPFVAELERAVGRARAAGTPTSLVVVRSADHPKSAAHHWAALVLGLVRPGDRVGALGPSELVVLLEGASREAAGEIALLIVTHDLDDPPLLCGAATFPEAAGSADSLLEAARSAAAETKLEAPVAVAPSLAGG